jgi:hypothetical protein
MISVYGKQLELVVIEHLVLLRKDEDQAPEIRNQPRINRLVASIRRHQNLGHRRQQPLQRELHQVLRQRILINVHYLVRRVRAVHLDHLVSVVHRLAVSVLDALLDVGEQQCFLPSGEPLSGWPFCFY